MQVAAKFTFHSKDLEKNGFQMLRNIHNEGLSAASFCRRVAALFPDVFCNFCLVKNHKIANNSATTEAREKISAYSEFSES